MRENSIERVRGIWDRYAPRYDRDVRVFERLMFGDGRQWVCSRAEGAVLEVAVGTGRNLAYYPPEVRLTGIDLSPAMLAIARGRAAGLDRAVELREANAQELPFENASFDTVVCTLGLCSIPDHRAAVAEMYRVLRPAGRVLLLDHVAAPNRLLRGVQRVWEVVTSRISADYQTRRPLPLLEQAGFRIQDVRRTKAGTVERLTAVKPAD